MPASTITTAERARADTYLAALRDLLVDGGMGADDFPPAVTAALFDQVNAASVRAGLYAMLRALLPGDPWHNIGDANEPPFESAWVNYNLATQERACYRLVDGVVHVRGMVKNGTTVRGDPIFTLPPSYRPRGNLVFFALDGSEALARVDVTAAGVVNVQVCGDNTALAFGLTFFADQ